MGIQAGALATLVTFSIGISAFTHISPAVIPASSNDDRVIFDKHKIEERHRESKKSKPTPQEKIRNHDDRNNNHEDTINIPPKKRLKYRDFDTCVPGRESVNSCNSIPQQNRCDDQTFPITRQILDEDGVVIRQYRYCPDERPELILPNEQLINEIKIDIERFRRYPIKGSALKSDPQKFSLKNGHTHFWASEEVQSFTSNLSGSTVRIRAIPVQWNWDYGDGSSKTRDFPGEPAPNHTLRDETPTSHSYSDTGTFQVEVTTLYRGEFSVDGGSWQAIPGQAAVPSEPLEIDVWRTEKELIASE